MKDKTRMILAIIALVLMLVFTVMLVIGLYDSSIMKGTVFYVAMASGVVAVALYVIIMRDQRIKAALEMEQKEPTPTPQTSTPQTSASQTSTDQASTDQASASQTSTPQTSASQTSTDQASTDQASTDQASASQTSKADQETSAG